MDEKKILNEIRKHLFLADFECYELLKNIETKEGQEGEK